jgi:hypothetical protein
MSSLPSRKASGNSSHSAATRWAAGDGVSAEIGSPWRLFSVIGDDGVVVLGGPWGGQGSDRIGRGAG